MVPKRIEDGCCTADRETLFSASVAFYFLQRRKVHLQTSTKDFVAGKSFVRQFLSMNKVQVLKLPQSRKLARFVPNLHI